MTNNEALKRGLITSMGFINFLVFEVSFHMIILILYVRHGWSDPVAYITGQVFVMTTVLAIHIPTMIQREKLGHFNNQAQVDLLTDIQQSVNELKATINKL